MNDQLSKKEPSEEIVEASTSDSLTKKEEFDPTPGMMVWIDTAIDIVSDSPTEIAEACKMSRQSWYDFLKVPGFEDWFYTQYKAKRRRWLPTLDKIGMQNAKRDYNYWKDMNKKAGESLEEQKGVAVQVNTIIGTKRNEYGF